jgi:hypothetical protein
MPVRKRIDKRRQEVTDQHEAWLHGADMGCGLIPYSPRDELATLWEAHSERIVAEHVAVYPGTRPARWWQFEMIEPRQRLGGTGTPASDVLAYLSRKKLPLRYRRLPAHCRDSKTGNAYGDQNSEKCLISTGPVIDLFAERSPINLGNISCSYLG